MRLTRRFYARPTLQVAPALLGQVLVRHVDGVRLAARIVETEAYVGEDDPACHAAHGRTPRTAVMYGPPGFTYVYFTYGMHHCLNVVTGREGFPAAVLIRAAEPLDGIEWMRARRGVARAELLASGPARLAQAFGLTREHSGLTLLEGPLGIERGARRAGESLGVSGRIGIRVATTHPWRFYLEGNPHVSKARPAWRPGEPAPGRAKRGR